MHDVRKVVLFTNEYPPYVYGGAGVHVEYLSRALAQLVEVEIRCFGDQDVQDENVRVRGYTGWPEATRGTDPRFAGALDALSRSLAMAKDTIEADLIHCHTWYTDLAGFWARLLWDLPLVITVHSLEPLRPWKAEQLGAGYRLSRWMERTGIEHADAVIAVSHATRDDVLRCYAVPPERVHVIHNGIDPEQYRKIEAVDALLRHGVDPEQPYVLFVGRVTRQKGIIHLVNAIPFLDPTLQVVLCAGEPDTEEIAREMTERVATVSAARPGVVWIREMLPRAEVIQLYSHAAVFCCPSVYEPFGIINLEAMACEIPVVASNVGGIPEVVVDGETGFLVDLELNPGTFEPVDPEGFSRALADAINRIARDPELRRRMGQAGRRRVEEHFSWAAIARQTLELYRNVTASVRRPSG